MSDDQVISIFPGPQWNDCTIWPPPLLGGPLAQTVGPQRTEIAKWQDRNVPIKLQAPARLAPSAG